jgi:hypothetical protein
VCYAKYRGAIKGMKREYKMVNNKTAVNMLSTNGLEMAK